jgi:hypothetical protein
MGRMKMRQEREEWDAGGSRTTAARCFGIR